MAAGNRSEVGFDPGLARTVVVRGDSQQAGDAERRRLAGHVNGVARVVPADPGDHRDLDRLQHRRDQAQMLLIVERRRLAGGAGNDQPVVAV